MRREPFVYVLRLDGHDAPIVAGGRDFRRWLIGDRGERKEIWLARRGPSRPQARDEHVLLSIGPELEDHVLRRLLWVGLPCDVLEEGVDDHHAMREAEDVPPERAAKVVGSSVFQELANR